MRFHARVLSGLILGACAVPGIAGVVNPNISAIGQLHSGITDDPGSPDNGEPTLALGESEFILEAPLNPFFKGWFTIAWASASSIPSIPTSIPSWKPPGP